MIPIRSAPPLATDPPRTPLTARELEIAMLVAEGLTVREIAEKLSVSKRTGRKTSPRVIANRIQEIAGKLHNPDGLKPMRLIGIWAGHAKWLATHPESQTRVAS